MVSHTTAYSFKPRDFVLVNCGSPTDATDADKRLWINDSSAQFFSSVPSSSFPAEAAETLTNLLPTEVPHKTARIFTSASTTTFTGLSEGRHFLRLYFYPSFYHGLDPKNAFFSVEAGPYTLLRNFSPTIAAASLNQFYIIQEFFITIPSSGNLTLSFIPSSSATFAFINGIEIISSPQLFYSGITNSSVAVGVGLLLPIYDHDVLQTVARLNVGGSSISPMEDSGLFRTWSDDSRYIFGTALGETQRAEGNVFIRYSYCVPDYIAPHDVYATARSMELNTSLNLNYNLTWSITVDNGFRYLIRLHFCELQQEVYKENRRVFNVYVNNMMADPEFDVILYASEKIRAPTYTGVAVYKDYMVLMPGQSGKESRLLIELQPVTDIKPFYTDAILNGLEVFKVNKTFDSLAGPSRSFTLPPPSETKFLHLIGGHGGEHDHIILCAIGGFAAVLSIGAFLFLVLLKILKKREKEKESHDDGALCRNGSSYRQPKKGKSDPTSATIRHVMKGAGFTDRVPITNCRRFKFSEIVAATNNFDDTLLLGVGGFSKVYMGVIDNGIRVAVKRGEELSQHGIIQFHNEIDILSKLYHCHLVSLIGFCEDSSEMILVYDYMHRGTFRQHLYGAGKPHLSWRQRLEICIGAAKALHYLHTGAKYTLVHRDVKTNNILIDQNWVAKVSDFGISRMGTSVDCAYMSTEVKGTFGYFDPEYFRTKKLTQKSDVYSFGVVLLEALCARPAVDMSRPSREIGLAEWALSCQCRGKLEEVIDPFLKGKIEAGCLSKFWEITERCLANRGGERPSMVDVLWNLELALRLQENAGETNRQTMTPVL
ncbi:receptor-like protein kinase FERONIA [Nymphaea colorata]|nr:receptor-like protein kinase FERONIA [Nymphaea colorata]